LKALTVCRGVLALVRLWLRLLASSADDDFEATDVKIWRISKWSVRALDSFYDQSQSRGKVLRFVQWRKLSYGATTTLIQV
jgi:hypothetical protein